MSNVLFNGLTAVHAGSNGTLVTSDVCKTPRRCRPVTYANIAKSSDAAMTATSVTINGNPACILTSNFAVSSGDEAGSCGGAASGTVKGMAEFITGSANVFIEGIPVVRQTDLMISNFKNTPPVPLQQPGAGKPSSVSAKGPKQLEAAELPFEVDIQVAGDNLKLLKSVIGVVDLGKAPQDEQGDAATQETTVATVSPSTNNSNSIAPAASSKPAVARKLLVKGVTGASEANVGDSLQYKVSKTNLPDPTPAELQKVSWQIKSTQGKVLYQYKNLGPKLDFEIDDTLAGKTFIVMPFINVPTKTISVSTSIELKTG
ncbi:hypothetical protein MNBD_GAMMA22-1165 [hydrothermal vent metagenome]|uniref:Uncharacterized protein n=1 Tax=hydrothermal vent metagenome TaxID=652676 RepID=A0A3B1A921_9ZZZZ